MMLDSLLEMSYLSLLDSESIMKQFFNRTLILHSNPLV